MKGAERDACRAWQLLMKFFFAQRGHLSARGEEFELSPVQCHVLHLIEPGRGVPMRRLAETLSCDASNVTGLIDRLERQPIESYHYRRYHEGFVWLGLGSFVLWMGLALLEMLVWPRLP